MIRVEFFCTVCNASAQRRDPGDEVSTGYAKQEVSRASDRTFETTIPAKWTRDADGRLRCPACQLVDPDARRLAAGTASRTPAPSSPDGWPSRMSPFEG